MNRWAAVAVMCGAWCGGLCACADEQPCPAPVFDTQGHRGARSHRPENTLPAFEYAIQAGVRTVELDLAVTRDDVLVVSHDPWLLPERCVDSAGQPADRVPIRSLTLAELQRFDCGRLQDPEFPDQQAIPGTPPPPLAAVFSLGEVRTGGRLRYNLEIKSDPAWGEDLTPTPEDFVRMTVAAVEAAGVQDRVTIQSFDARPLRVLRDQRSPLTRALLWPSAVPGLHAELLRNTPVEAAQLLGCSILAPFAPITRAPLVAAAHTGGLKVIPWTVNDRAEMQRLMDLGVDGIISDDVDLLLATEAEEQPRGGVCF